MDSKLLWEKQKLSQPLCSQEKNVVSITDGWEETQMELFACSVEKKEKLTQELKLTAGLFKVRYVTSKKSEFLKSNFKVLNSCIYSV